ncbi:hypothetical protein GG344DRAFT_83598 [Lentinula edodes]|nr:hypothetical protein GG344DRAFT_83598 [Lentinula edodes]
MSFDCPCHSTSRASSPLLPTPTSLGEVAPLDPESNGEVEQDQLAFTIESPSRPQLQLFKTAFNTGRLLSAYCKEDPQWSLLVTVASPCTNCLKTPSKCQVSANSPRCTNCSSKKTCSLSKILLYRHFTRQCNQDLAYSRRFLELHGTPAHCATWGIPLDVWHQYGAALHEHTSSTSTLLELNMLDEQDEVDADQQELQKFLALQQDEASKVWLEAPKKRSHHKSPEVEVASGPPRCVLLVVPPGRSSVTATTTPVPPHNLPSPMEVSVRNNPMQGSSGLVQLATIAEAHSGLAHQLVSPPAPQMPIKGGESDIFTSNMPPTPCSMLVPRILTAHPDKSMPTGQ